MPDVFARSLLPLGPGHYVYRLWRDDDACLYVGSAGGRAGQPSLLTERLRRAVRDHDWYPEIAYFDWAEYPTSVQAARVERIQIQALKPVHNQAMKVCRKGHDITEPGSQTGGTCKQCARAYQAAYLPGWRQRNADKIVGYQVAFRERLGETEYAVRQRRYQSAYRARQRVAPGQEPLFL